MPKLKCFFALQFILVILLLQFSSCKQENLAQPEKNELTIEQAKSWYSRNVQGIQGVKKDTTGSQIKRLDKFIRWASFHDYKTKRCNFILVDIDDSAISFSHA